MAKIADLLAAGPTYSFEFMPPKTPEMLRELEKTLQQLEPLQPSFCSVTYGAGGSTRSHTKDAVMHIHHDTSMVAMPHLTCVGQTRAEIRELLESYRDAGLENVLALAGDPPQDGIDPGEFTYAVELIELAREIGEFSVGVSAFPEVHPKSPDRASDRRFLAAKLELADLGITQFFWTVDHYFRMVDELEALGCTTPVIPSVFPIVNVAGAKRFSSVNGTEFPAWLAERVEPLADDPEELRKVGVEIATDLGQQLLDRGVPGLHIYTLNRPNSATTIWNNLGLTARR
ncbi:MAG TPA: methylenetetrahydrofolate reductase [Acidimicrobiales bacterium]|nr:methylenetetrahydrofolate reductase [Acidimicrobiales bacterium]